MNIDRAVLRTGVVALVALVGCTSELPAIGADGSAAADAGAGDAAVTRDGPADLATAPDMVLPGGDAGTDEEPLPTGFPELPVPPVPSGKVLRVGAGQGRMYRTPCAAIAAAQTGDTIEIDAGAYPGDTCRISTSGLTIRGVGGLAVLDLSNVRPAECKAIWVIGGSDTVVESVEFTGAHLRPADPHVVNGSCQPDRNGAGIRQEGKNLTVRGCSFHDNDEGILTSNSDGSAILVERSRFYANSFDGFSHNLYVNRVDQLTFRYNYSARTTGDGHLLKSRARRNIVLYNRLTGEDGRSSYELTFPNGGETYVIGNVLQQGNTTSNRALLDYASEGVPAGYAKTVHVVNNTFVSRRGSGATFLQMRNMPSCAAANNLFIGNGNVTDSPAAVREVSNVTDADGDPRFVDEGGYDFHLGAGSTAADAAGDPGMANGYSLTPVNEYVHPASARARNNAGRLDVGAFAYP